MKKSYAIAMSAFALLFGFAVGQKRMEGSIAAQEIEKPVSIRWVVWKDSKGNTKNGDVILAKSRGKEFVEKCDTSSSDLVQIHGDIDGQPFMIYTKFEE